VNDAELKVARIFVEPFLEEIYSDSVKKARLRRALEQIRHVLRNVLKTHEVPSDLNQLTGLVHTELSKQSVLDDVDMNLIAAIIHKCF